jgi:hypothetical protein
LNNYFVKNTNNTKKSFWGPLIKNTLPDTFWNLRAIQLGALGKCLPYQWVKRALRVSGVIKALFVFISTVFFVNTMYALVTDM